MADFTGAFLPVVDLLSNSFVGVSGFFARLPSLLAEVLPVDLAGVAAAAEVGNDCVEAADAAVAIDDATWFFDLKNFLGVSAVTMILGLPVLVLDTLSHSARSSNLVIFVVVQGFQKKLSYFLNSNSCKRSVNSAPIVWPLSDDNNGSPVQFC